jgi:hypothetical protein
VIDSVNLKIKSAQSFRCTYRSRIYVYSYRDKYSYIYIYKYYVHNKINNAVQNSRMESACKRWTACTGCAAGGGW